jgi:hypothetical protein
VRVLVCGGLFVEQLGDRRRLGGSALTASLAAARVGAEVSLASWVGRGAADQAFALLDQAGVDRLGVVVVDGETTTFRIAEPGGMGPPAPTLLQGAVPTGGRPALPWAGVTVCFGTPGYDVISEGWLDRVCFGGLLVFDRQGGHSRVLGAEMAATVPAARRILLANVHEVNSGHAHTGVSAALATLPPEGFEAAVVKAGRWGTTVLRRDTADVTLGAHRVDVASLIGSGDVFAGVLGARLAEGLDLSAAAVDAGAAAAVWISGEYEEPPVRLGELAAGLSKSPALWVDPRQLAGTRWRLLLPNNLREAEAQRVTRALRYLGVETEAVRADAPLLDVRAGAEAGGEAGAITSAIEIVRERLGVLTG